MKREKAKPSKVDTAIPLPIPCMIRVIKPTDNRMLWIRKLEELKTAKETYDERCEIASEAQISSNLRFEDEKIHCMRMGKNQYIDDLYCYQLKIIHPAYNGFPEEIKASKTGYVSDGIEQELMSLFSLFLRCRFFLIGHTNRFKPEDIDHRSEERFYYRPCNPLCDPALFAEKSFHPGMVGFLAAQRKPRGLAPAMDSVAPAGR